MKWFNSRKAKDNRPEDTRPARNEYVFLLDRSGSMLEKKAGVIDRVNSIIGAKKRRGVFGFVSVLLFDEEIEVLVDHESIEQVRLLTDADYAIKGCSAPMDAIGDTIQQFRTASGNLPNDPGDSRLYFMIATDGGDNSSCRYSRSKVVRMISRQMDRDGWRFSYLCAPLSDIRSEKKRFRHYKQKFVQFRGSDKNPIRYHYDVRTNTLIYSTEDEIKSEALKQGVELIFKRRIHLSPARRRVIDKLLEKQGIYSVDDDTSQ